jgi:transposase-like protein
MRAEILAGPERRRRWSAEQKLRIVREAAEPGVSVAEVVRRHDLSRQQIYQWRAVARDGRLREATAGSVGFLQIDLAAPLPDAASSAQPVGEVAIEIGLGNGRLLRAPSSLPSSELRRLIRAVEGA